MPSTKDEAIRVRAYEIWVAEGRPHGHDYDHWLRAVREVEAEVVLEVETPPAKKAAKPRATAAKASTPKPATTKTAAGKAAKAIAEETAPAAAKPAKKPAPEATADVFSGAPASAIEVTPSEKKPRAAAKAKPAK